ncbi:type II toxin-antitoxin system RelB/DinJ family antitoxin [Aeromonas bestiarum]|nr:type II toxin-antitoxin system RelB/DinJ family antitoxin [Aeromonas bestiarum]
MKAQIDPRLLQEAAPIFRELGLTVAQAINVFLAKSIKVQGLPFSVTLDEPSLKVTDAIPNITNAEITEALQQLIENVLVEDELMQLCQRDHCRTTFGINFPVFKLLHSIEPEAIRLSAKDDKGYNRYSTTRIARRGEQAYLICTQWTDRHRRAFVRWYQRYSA